MNSIFNEQIKVKTDLELENIKHDYKQYTLWFLKDYLQEVKSRKLQIEHISRIEDWVSHLELKKFNDDLLFVPKLSWEREMTKNELINSRQFLGLKLITRNRFKSVVSKSREHLSIIKFPALSVINAKGLTKDLELINSKKELLEIVCDILISTFNNLHNQSYITINAVQDKFQYLNIYKVHKELLSVTLIKSEKTEDILSNKIIDVLNEVKSLNADFTYIIIFLFDKLIGKKKSFTPEKDFIVNLIKLYSTQTKIVTFSISKNVFGLGGNYIIRFDETIIKDSRNIYKEKEIMKLVSPDIPDLELFQYCRMRNDITNELLRREIDFG